MKTSTRYAFFVLLVVLYGAVSNGARAQEGGLTQDERRGLAQSFLQKMKSGFSKADRFLNDQPIKLSVDKENILTEGEDLLLQVRLDRSLTLDDVILGKVQNQEVLLSFRDFVRVLNLPIDIDSDLNARGWYVKEANSFQLSAQNEEVVSAEGSFEFPENRIVNPEDLYFPIDSYTQWFGFDFDLSVPDQSFLVASDPPLPQVAKYKRANKSPTFVKRKEAELPLGSRDAAMIDFPLIDVNTNSTFSRDGQSDLPSRTRHSANIRTSGDFLNGTLFTQTFLTDEDQLDNIRATYKQESLEPELLGPLKARKYQLGDVIQSTLPIEDGRRQELGFQVTNEHPLRVFNKPVTSISGNVPAGWDVELYRGEQGTQFVDIIRVGDDGFYSFDDVLLFDRDNVFLLRFYGPQGEEREEYVSIPVDRTLSEGETTYDVSLTFDRMQAYRKNKINDEDRGSPTLRAFAQKPLAPGTFGSLGFMSNQQNDERNNVAYAGLSTTVKEVLVDASVGLDDEAEAAAEVNARLSAGEHNFINRNEWRAENFDTASNGDENDGFFRTQLNANGPLGLNLGRDPTYTGSVSYFDSSNGFQSFTGSAGVGTRFGRFGVSEALSYTTNNTSADDQFIWTNVVNGRYGKNNIRFFSDYEIQPDAGLKSLRATLRRNVLENSTFDLEFTHQADTDLTEVSSRLNWQAGFARISPSITYNSDNDLFAGLATSFGIAKDPVNGEIYSFDRNVTSNGAMSVQVFLDENGDGVLNANEQPLEGVQVQGLQNGGQKETNEKGVAFFNNMAELRRTDVVINEDSLKDPFWISGFEGVSVLPREGYVAELSYPVHIAGEMDGTVYSRDENLAEPRPLKGIPVHLYNADGEVEQTATTDFGGFYIFSRIPPGRYLLVIDRQTAETNNIVRPLPQQIEIGYDGTIIYGNDIYAEEGQGDIPSEIMSDLTDYRELHPHIDFATDEYNIVLNLGEYNSRLLMSTQWYRLHTRYRPIISGGELLVQPQDSYADPVTGKHVLRVGYRNAGIEDAYGKCRALMSRGIECLVEVYAGAYNKVASTEQDMKKL
ncbi:MAG: hypothetical protein JKY71_00965 [Alphaproteobacteria bacterium]|nr:hypothetical protein [Alphaproteobacteria bacterium]